MHPSVPKDNGHMGWTGYGKDTIPQYSPPPLGNIHECEGLSTTA